MFDFEKLTAYALAKEFNRFVKGGVLSIDILDRITRDQLRRASTSVMLNIAEGTSRFSKADKRNFYVIARGSLFECMSILDLFQSEGIFDMSQYKFLYGKGEQLSKMLYTMIRNLEGAKR